MRIGVLTGGGDCPGLNAVIRAVVRKGVQVHGHEFVGYRDGWAGPLEGRTMPLGVAEVRGILPRGGTILGSSRTNPLKEDDGVARVRAQLGADGVDGLVVIGGEDTLGVATALHEEGLPVVGVPKTIDNDLGATDYTFGFDTAVTIATDALDRLAHDRGEPPPGARLRGHGPARRLDRAALRARRGRQRHPRAGAPVRPRPRLHLRHASVRDGLRVRRRRRRGGSAEGRPDGHVVGGHGRLRARPARRDRGPPGPGDRGAHRPRGPRHRPRPRPARRQPTAYDRVLATRLGLHAVDAITDGDLGVMVALQGTEIVRVPLAEATKELKTVPPERYREAEVFFGS